MSVTLAAVWITLIVCVTTAVVVGMYARSAARQERRQPVDSEQLLAERFARGEIDEAEYAARLSVLRIGPPLHTYLDR
jgi:putative membrane protein